MTYWDKYIIYFKSYEFDSPDVEGSGSKMQKDFIVKLDLARSYANIPFRVTSGYRTESHNRKVGGVENSSHRRGFAADISATTNLQRIKIVKAAVYAGIPRIGISENFIHLDDDPTKRESLWLYPASKGVFSMLLKYFSKSEDV